MWRAMPLASIVLAFGLMAAPTHAAPAKQFKDMVAVGDFTNDYSVELGTLKILKNHPLHIQLRIAPESESKYAAEAMFRAFLWGVYRTFLHTSLDQVTVTVLSPTPVDGHTKMTATVTRARALETVQQIPGVSTWDDLLTKHQTWSEPMKRCMYSSYGKPGLRDCALKAAGKLQTP